MGTSESESAGNQTNTTGEVFGAFGVAQRNFLKDSRIRHAGIGEKKTSDTLSSDYPHTARRLHDVPSIEMNLPLIKTSGYHD